MNKNLIKLCKSDTINFSYLDVLLENNIVDIKTLEDFFINNISDNTILFLEHYLNEGINVNRIEEAIIKSGNPKYIYNYTLYIKKRKNISKLEKAITKSGDARQIYKFACNEKNANIGKLEEAIIKSGNADYIYLFACNVKGANIGALEVAYKNSLNSSKVRNVIEQKNSKEKYFSLEDYIISVKNDTYKESIEEIKELFSEKNNKDKVKKLKKN